MWTYKEDSDKYIVSNSKYHSVHYFNKNISREKIEIIVQILREAEYKIQTLVKDFPFQEYK